MNILRGNSVTNHEFGIMHSNNSNKYPINYTLETDSNGFSYYRFTRTNITSYTNIMSLYNTIYDKFVLPVAGKTLTCSCLVRVSHDTNVQIMNYFVDTDDVRVNGTEGKFQCKANQWTLVHGQITLPDNWKYNYFRFCPYAIEIPEGKISDFWLDSSFYKVEYGSIPTGYSPCPMLGGFSLSGTTLNITM